MPERPEAVVFVNGFLARDRGIVRTVGQHNRVASVTLAPGVIFPAVAGVYAMVLHPGRICRGNLVGLQGES